MTHLAWPEGYNAAWNELRLKYQGIKPPVERSEASFDPGAKYHIPATTPYLRYFLANVLQFQFYKAACEQSGWKGPLHRCSFYDNKAVGKKFNTILEMGASRPWPDALEAFINARFRVRRSSSISRRCKPGLRSRTKAKAAAGKST